MSFGSSKILEWGSSVYIEKLIEQEEKPGFDPVPRTNSDSKNTLSLSRKNLPFNYRSIYLRAGAIPQPRPDHSPTEPTREPQNPKNYASDGCSHAPNVRLPQSHIASIFLTLRTPELQIPLSIFSQGRMLRDWDNAFIGGGGRRSLVDWDVVVGWRVGEAHDGERWVYS